jgi:hypothetical protein
MTELKQFKWSHLFIGLFILIFSIFILYVGRCILEEHGLTINKLERYFHRSRPPSVNLEKNDTNINGNPTESKGESHARNLAQVIFGKPFIKTRPDFLKNNVTGHNLELDLYNDDLKLAIEYSGAQHYKYIPFFHKNYEHFQTQKYRDEIKKMLCEKNGIKLIEIPYTVKLKDMENFIRLQAKKLGFDI